MDQVEGEKSGPGGPQLIFFDTFAHLGSEETHLDLVQFNKPVRISEIRVIPLGAKIEADFAGGVRLGATNPSSFPLRFFINDLGRLSSTFSDLGSFPYQQNVNIQFMLPENRATDGLLIEGVYSTLTIAVFGFEKVDQEYLLDNVCSPAQSPVPQETAVETPEVDSELKPENILAKFDPQKSMDVLEVIEQCISQQQQRSSYTPDDNLGVEKRPPSPPPMTGVSRLDSRCDDVQRRTSPTTHAPDQSSFGITKHSPPGSQKRVERTRGGINEDERRQQQRRRSRTPTYRDRERYRSSRIPSRSPPRKVAHVHSRSPERRRVERKPSPPPLKVDTGYTRTSWQHRKTKSPEPERTVCRPPRSPPQPDGRRISRSPMRERERSKEERRPVRRRESPVTLRPSPLPQYVQPRNQEKYRARSRSLDRIAVETRRKSRSPQQLRRKPSPVPLNRLPIHSSQKDTPTSEFLMDKLEDSLEPISPPALDDAAESISSADNLDDIVSVVAEAENVSIGKTAASESDGEVLDNISSDDYCDGDSMNGLDDMLIEEREEDSEYVNTYNFVPYCHEFTPLKESRNEPENETIKDLEELKSLLQKFKSPGSRNEKWVEAVEGLCENAFDDSAMDDEVIMDLMDWVRTGLNFEIAIQQAVTPFKVRHMKAAVKLVAALSSGHFSLLPRMIREKVPGMLLELYGKPYMSLPVKLHILTCLGKLCNSVLCMEHFKSELYDFESGISQKTMTCYQKVLLLLIENPPTRIITSIATILKKIKLFEALSVLRELDLKARSEPDVKFESSVLAMLSEIASSFSNIKQILQNPFRYLPASSQFKPSGDSGDNYVDFSPVVQWLGHFDFFSTLATISSSTKDKEIADEVIAILAHVMDNEYLLEFAFDKQNLDSLNRLKNNLIESEEYSKAREFGKQFAYRLHAFQLFDVIEKSCQSGLETTAEVDEVDLMSSLHKLHALTLNPCGLEAVIKIIAKGSKFTMVFKLSEGAEDFLNSKTKPVIVFYTQEIISTTIMFLNEDLLEFFRRNRSTLTSMVESTSKDTEKLPRNLSDYLQPFVQLSPKTLNNEKLFSYCEETFRVLVDSLKKELEQLSSDVSNQVYSVRPQAVTTLRILEALCVSQERQSSCSSTAFSHSPVGLHYPYAIAQVFSMDGLPIVLSLMQRMTDTYLRPTHRSRTFVGTDGGLVMSFAVSSVKLVRAIITSLVRAKEKDFKDHSAIPVLLHLFLLMKLYPASSFFYHEANTVASEIVETLLLYTSYFAELDSAEDTILRDSIWTKTFQQIVKFTTSTPFAFTPGLVVLSEFLPLPLPIMTKEYPNTGEVSRVLNLRKLWTAHIHVISSDVENLVASLAPSSNSEVQEILRRVCIQMSDLSAESAMFVCKCVLSTFADIVAKQPHEVALSTGAENVILLLSSLTHAASFKTALLSSLSVGATTKNDIDKCPTALPTLMLLFTSQQQRSRTRKNLANFFMALCDHRISLASHDQMFNEKNISNASPKEIVTFVVSKCLKHLSQGSWSTDYLMETAMFQILAMLSEHDLGASIIRSNLMSSECRLLNVTHHEVVVKKTCGNRSAGARLIIAFTEFIKQVSALTLDVGKREGRTLKLGHIDVRRFLIDESVHFTGPACMQELTDFVNDSGIEFKELPIAAVLRMACDDHASGQPGDVSEPWSELFLPVAEPLKNQFANRQVFQLLSSFNGDLGSRFSLLDIEEPSEIKDSNALLEQANLYDLGKLYCGQNFDLAAQLAELWKCQDSSEGRVVKLDTVASSQRNCELLISARETAPFAKRPYPTSMRGSRGGGFNRQSGPSHNRGDPFRSRPPNTSRPPSVHVDDFICSSTFSSSNVKLLKRNSSDYGKRPLLSPAQQPRGPPFGDGYGHQHNQKTNAGGNGMKNIAINRHFRDDYSPAIDSNTSSYWSRSGTQSSSARRDNLRHNVARPNPR